ncbi:hypothetical protein HHK36_011284 [Tetracentron sinense]|uniref:ARM repeat superfamily protein n=1 Tax=Tetracentron sinense TaxID=13715 RepID=A0A835DJR4_TETSI|nr:hypothetical protein HHK36_011284 [Tetracentron sinense]
MLFDISTTVDPSYIISLIRKLLPRSERNSNGFHVEDVREASVQGSETEGMKGSIVSVSSAEFLNSPNSKTEAMDTLDDLDGLDRQTEIDEGFCHNPEHPGESVGEEAWEEYGCILWDLAASKTHAEFMVQNLILEVLLANLTISQSMRATEINLGIIGNLACHEVPRNHLVSMNGLIETIVGQLFLDDSSCLCEACRLLTLGLQGSGSITWAEALQPEDILRRIQWIAENTLNVQLLERSIGLLLAIVENQQEVASILLPPLMKLGLPSLLINLLACELNKLNGERMPDRYIVLDTILRAIEALCVVDDFSHVICSDKELFRLVYDLVKLPDKVEVANSCVTSAVLIANLLTDVPDLASGISQDLPFIQGLLDIFPFVSEARCALWSIFARVLVQFQEGEMSPSSLRQFVSILVEKSDLIEEDLLDHQLEDSNKDHKSF